MKGSIKTKKSRPLRRWLILQSVSIVILSVMAFLLVEFFVNIVLRQDPDYNAIDGIGMIGPMGILMWLLSYNIMKKISRYLSELMNAISGVAGGDFAIRMNEETAGPVKELYKNFNKMTSELEGVQTLRDDFINHFSHEFKTPIASINGFTRLLLEDDVTIEEQKKYLGIIAAESDRLARMSESTLLLTKLESQHILPDTETYQLDEQIRQCIILLMPQMNDKDIDLSVNLSQVGYDGNEDLMKHVWMNLLGNALKYSDRSGKIGIELTEDESAVVVSISDSGPGMSEEAVARACEKYYQDESRVSHQGLGLGLAIVNRIIDICDGKLEISTSPGNGSCFTVFLPKN